MAVKVIPSTKQGLLPTPPMPRELPKAELTDNARQVLVKRYVRRGEDGQPAETVEEMFWRVAYHVAKAEDNWGGDVNARAVEFYHLLTSKKFFPNSPTFTGAGTPLGQLAACQPYHARVVTSRGLIPIGELVEKQTASDVVTFQPPESDEPVSAYRAASANFGPVRLGKILAGVPNGVRPVMRVTVLGGVHLDVTPDHHVWASPPSKHGRFGWHEAGEIEPGWLLMVDSRPKPFPAEQVEGFDEATAAVVAWLQADGYVGQPATATSPIVEFETIHDDEFNWIQEQIARSPLVEFHQKVHEEVVQNEALQYRRIRIYGKEPYALLRQYGLAERKAAARVPEQVFRSPVSVVASYLRALFQCDGSVERSGFISVSSVSCQLLEGVQLLLLQLGISSQIIAYHHSRERRLPNYKLHIGLYSSRVLFEQKVGFVSREKQEKLATLNQQGGKQQSTLRAVEVDRVAHLGEMPVFDIQTSDSTYLSAHLAVHNCFVLPITDDMGRDRAGIFQTLRDAALIQQTGGGNGFSFSRLRPKGGLVKSSAGQATGPVGFLRVYDHAFGEVAQGGTRRGANMGVLRVDHPDVEEFITCKTNENAITNFNISVGITDAFMRAVKEDEEWELRFPDIAAKEYRKWSGTLEQAEKAGMPIRSYGKVRARGLFDKIVKQAHHNGEPGVLFLDAANRGNPVPHLYQLESTNPCVTGETMIYTDNGLRRADELAAEGTEIAVTSDARFGTETFLPATHVFQTGVKPVYRLLTREGYELRLTEDHRVMTSQGWVETRHLHVGDRLHILNRKGGFGATGTLEEGRVLGWLVGDGTVNVVRAALSFFGDEKRELAPMFAEAVTDIVDRPGQRRSYPVSVTQIEERDEARVSSERLRVWAAQFGITKERKHFVPSQVFSGSEDIQRGFLQALFTADGQVNDGGEKGCSVRLSASRLPLLKDAQRLLLNFGIASRIYENRRSSGYRLMPDGKGGTKEYFHQAQHDLAIGKANLIRFANEIGFLAEAKQGKLADYLSRMSRGPYEEAFLATVMAVEPDGVEPVFDLHQPATHAFIANGLVVHNCGEQFLGPYENCCLGSVNLNEHCGPNGTVDWETLRKSVVTATRFLDDVVEANAYVPAVPQLKEAAHRARRIGLGIMGLADLMYHAGVRYGSKEGQEFGAQVMEFVRYHAMQASIELAEARGPFPAIEGSIYDPDDLKWTPPQPLTPYQNRWTRPEVKWEAILDGIRRHGIRNAAQTTVAPTGTIATVAGCEGYGCEPVFALAYIRHVNDHGKDLRLTYASPRFDEALNKLGLGEEKRQEIVEQVMSEGSCQRVAELPQAVRDTFVVSADISAEEHVRMQAALQMFVDNSLSKTVNCPANATEHDVANAYMLAWELGCKGITVYVTGSREKVVLETKATADKKAPAPPPALEPAPVSRAVSPTGTVWHETKKPRPRALTGRTFNVDTPVGKAFITINENGGTQPFEAFINTAKAGSETAAVSEAIGRLISYILRMASPILPTDRMKEIVRQLMGIGGGRSLGFGPNRVRSLPDGIGQVLDHYLREKDGIASDPVEEKSNGNGGHITLEAEAAENAAPMRIGDLCPECGEAAVVNEEGCRKCYACGYSEC